MAFFVYYRSKKYQRAYQHRARNLFQARFIDVMFLDFFGLSS